MKKASVTLYKETLSKNQQVPVGFSRRWKKGKWGLISAEVLEIRGLSFGAKCVFSALSIHGKGNEIIAASHGQIAGWIGGERSTVSGALDALEELGLISKVGLAGRDQIQAYRMLHPLLIRKSRQEGEEAPESKEKPKLVACGKCRKPCVPGLTGRCRKCMGDVELDGKIARRVNAELAQRGIVTAEDAGDTVQRLLDKQVKVC